MREFLFVVVLYQMSLSQAQAIRSLLHNRAFLREHSVNILILNNTPGVQPKTRSIANGVEYVSFGENRGLAYAYQFAFVLAQAKSYRFLVLLDQDSEVESNYLHALSKVVEECQAAVGIWCPNVVSGGMRISPYSLNALGWPNFTPHKEAERLYGINSFSVLSVEFIASIGGFNQFYWLDCLDFWLYEKARENGWIVRRLDVSTRHNLSLISGNLSLTRMMNIAFYESCFVAEHGQKMRIVGTILRLIVRGMKRSKVMGGGYSLGRYLREIIRGTRVGLRRRKAVSRSFVARDEQ